MFIEFSKYQGTGNDFVMIDNRSASVKLNEKQIAFICDRRFGVGADGLILLEKQADYDFKMVYYNADGKESSMCGNGGRCITQFANDMGIKKEKYRFLAIDGAHLANIKPGEVQLKMSDVNYIEQRNEDVFVLNTGSPHYVKFDTRIQQLDMREAGRKIRYSDEFSEAGINVNFVEVMDNTLFVRTYERGVEDETLSCGTGVTAAVLSYMLRKGMNEITQAVKTPGGNLQLSAKKKGEIVEDVWLCGAATFVFSGKIEI